MCYCMVQSQVCASGFRLVHDMLHEVQIPAVRRQIGARLVRSLSKASKGSNKPALFDGIGAGGYAAKSLVYSAYVELFHHVVNELEQEHPRWKSQEKKTRGSTYLLVFLPLLQTLVTMLTPSLLHYITSTRSPKEHSNPGLIGAKVGSLASRTEQVGSSSISTQGWPGRLDRASSAPSITRTDSRTVKSPSVAENEAISVVITAVPLLSAILDGEGNILRSDEHSPNEARERKVIHYAAWRALSEVSTQVCFSQPEPTKYANNGGTSLEDTHQAAGGHHTSSLTEISRHRFARGAKQWWRATQEVLAVLFKEVARTKECLEQLLHDWQAQEEVLRVTGAVQLIADPVPLPFPSTLNFSVLLEGNTADYFASSFWVWGADCISHQPGQNCDSPQGNLSSGVRSEYELCSRTAIFFRTREASLQKGPSIRGPDRDLAIFLTPWPSHERKRKDGNELYIELVLFGGRGREYLIAQNGAHPGEVGEEGFLFSTPHVPTTTVSTGGLDEDRDNFANGGSSSEQVLRTDRLFSDCTIPAGRWTHVCCTYSNIVGNEKSPLTDRDSSEGTASAMITFNGRIVAKQAFPSCALESDNKKTSQSPQAPSPSKLQIGGGHAHNMSTPTSTCPQVHGQCECTTAVCDLHWHSRVVSVQQMYKMAKTGASPERWNIHHEIDCYIVRLVALVEGIAASSQRAATALASSRWLSLWLETVPLAGQRGQRAVIRLLRPLLCVLNQATVDDVEDVKGDTSNPIDCSLTPCSAHEFDDRAVVFQLCGFLGRSMTTLLDRSWSSDSEVIETEKTGKVNDFQCRDKLSPVLQESFMTSEIVLLLRTLVVEAPTRWREPIFTSLANELATASKKGFLTSSVLSGSGGEVNEEQNIQLPAWLGAAAAAAYLGGGHIEGLRYGATVILLPRSGLLTVGLPSATKGCSETTELVAKGLDYVCSNMCVSAETVAIGEEAVQSACRGTVVGWTQSKAALPTSQEGILFVAVEQEHQGFLDEASYHSTTLKGILCPAANNRLSKIEFNGPIVAIPFQHAVFHAEKIEPVTPFLFELALPAVLALVQSLHVPSSSMGKLVDTREPGRGAFNSIGANLISSHLRCRLIRALAVQLRHAHQATAALHGKVLAPLLTLGALSLESAAVLALGSDNAVVFGQRSDFAAIILSLRHQPTAPTSSNCLLYDLERASQIVWSRLSSEKVKRGSPRPRYGTKSPHSAERGPLTSCSIGYSHPTLQVLDGEALVEGNRVTASSHFPTIRLSQVRVGLSSAGGRWYYEVTLLTGGLMQVGWAGPLFQCSPVRGQGVGDHMHSWAFDGFRQKRWCESSAPYGKRWRAGDVVGVLLDAGLQEMRFR